MSRPPEREDLSTTKESRSNKPRRRGKKRQHLPAEGEQGPDIPVHYGTSELQRLLLEDRGHGCCKGLGCEGKILNTLLLMLEFLLIGGIAGLRLRLSMAPGFLCHSSEPEDNLRWRSARELGSTTGTSRRGVPPERGEQTVYMNTYRLQMGCYCWITRPKAHPYSHNEAEEQ